MIASRLNQKYDSPLLHLYKPSLLHRYKQNRGFSIFELVAVLSITLIMTSIAVPLFTAYQLRSKTSEALIALSKMVTGESRLFTEQQLFVAAGPTNIPPGERSLLVDFSSDPNWRALQFDINSAIYFGYEAVLNSATDVDCRAIGDLDGDGVTSLFQRNVVASGPNVTANNTLIFDEIE